MKGSGIVVKKVIYKIRDVIQLFSSIMEVNLTKLGKNGCVVRRNINTLRGVLVMVNIIVFTGQIIEESFNS